MKSMVAEILWHFPQSILTNILLVVNNVVNVNIIVHVSKIVNNDWHYYWKDKVETCSHWVFLFFFSAHVTLVLLS